MTGSLQRHGAPAAPGHAAAAVRGSKSRLRAGEIAQMVRLGALRRAVRREADRHRVILLDEGPVFALSWLDVFFARNGDRVPAAWRQHVVADWSQLLDVVVFIDASDVTLAERIRADRPDVQVIYMSGYTDDVIVHHGVLEAGDRFVEKPVARDALLHIIRTALDAGKR